MKGWAAWAVAAGGLTLLHVPIGTTTTSSSRVPIESTYM
jgi:hypothetical protein